MRKVFITYGDSNFANAKLRIIKQAKALNIFDDVISYGPEDLSAELLNSNIVKINRGGGLWSWKPDIILTTMNKAVNGDIIVYCDAGCTLSPSKEWDKYWNKLKDHDIIAQRIFQRTDKWTRKELLDLFSTNTNQWHKCFQYQATPIFVVSDFSKKFVREWRDLMINKPILAMDVTKDERIFQHKNLKENRHDQAVYSCLIYKYLSNTDTKSKICTQWEHLEDFDLLFKQAIRATRLRNGEEEIIINKIKGSIKRLIKDYCLKPLYYMPLQWYYSTTK